VAVKNFSMWGVIFILFFFSSSSFLQAETFKWVDDSGAVHYSDQPLKDENSEWIDEDEKTYFSYKPSKELKNGKAPVLPSGNTSPKTSQQKIKYRPKVPVGEASFNRPPQASSTGSYARPTPATRASGARISEGRTSAGRTSGARISEARTSAGRTSGDRTSEARTSAGRTSGDRTSEARTSAGRTSGALTSGERAESR
jgi:hypothetical protein